MEKIDTGGFTLAELLIVVAIIAVLVAIAIPMFTGSLEKSRESVHRSNATTLKSLAIQDLLTHPEKYDANTLSAHTWKVSGTYDFTSEKFVSVTVTSAAGFSPVQVKYSGTGKNSTKLSGAEIGKIPTSGTVEYSVWVNQTDLSEMFTT